MVMVVMVVVCLSSLPVIKEWMVMTLRVPNLHYGHRLPLLLLQPAHVQCFRVVDTVSATHFRAGVSRRSGHASATLHSSFLRGNTTTTTTTTKRMEIIRKSSFSLHFTRLKFLGLIISTLRIPFQRGIVSPSRVNPFGMSNRWLEVQVIQCYSIHGCRLTDWVLVGKCACLSPLRWASLVASGPDGGRRASLFYDVLFPLFLGVCVCGRGDRQRGGACFEGVVWCGFGLRGRVGVGTCGKVQCVSLCWEDVHCGL